MSVELLLAAALVSATPVLFAALGELLTERAGVLNLGLEGTMLVGAVSGFAVATVTASAALGAFGAMAAGASFGLLFAVLVITLRLNQVVTGLSLTILGTGLSAFAGKPFIGVPPKATVQKVDIGVLSDLPFVGPILFAQDPLVYLAVVLTAAIAVFLTRTRAGLVLRALGESPDVVDALGHPVAALRYLYVMAGTALAGLGGAYLSLSFTPSWIEMMTAGRGWIAIALVVFAVWRPWWIFAGALCFGAVDALRFRAQVSDDLPFDVHFMSMLPYLATIAVLAFVSRGSARRRLGVPAALGIAFDRERR